jgi:uncharacterized protein YlxW (UPF0749 family)
VKQRSAQIVLAVVCFALGIMLVTQFRTHTRIVRQTMPVTEQVLIIGNLSDANQKLRQEVEGLRRQLEEYEQTVGKSDLDRMVQDINQLRVVNGSSEVSGPGIQLNIGGDFGPLGRMRAEELQDLVNELRDAGAEAIAVNGVRLVANSSFIGASGGIILNGDRLLVAPYTFDVIGQGENLERALTRQGGLVAYFSGRYPGAELKIFRKSTLVLPKADNLPSLRVAQLVE